jgi:hypothetical protein
MKKKLWKPIKCGIYKPDFALKLYSFPGFVWSFCASLHFCEGCWVFTALYYFWKYFCMAFGSSSLPSTLSWPPNSYCAMDSLSRGLHSALGTCCFLHPCLPRICDVSLWMTSSHLFVGFPTGLVLRNFPLRTFFWYHLITCSFRSSNFIIHVT